MDEWIDYYDSTHTIYVSKLHRDLHFAVIARDIIGYIASPDAVVLDYACGEALSAATRGGRLRPALSRRARARRARPADRALCAQHEDPRALAGGREEDGARSRSISS